MCVIERKTYVHPGGRQEIVESRRRCHRAVGETLCNHVERKNREPVYINEVKPSTKPAIVSQQPQEDLIVAGDKTYRKVTRRKYSHSKTARPSSSTLTTPVSPTPSSSSSPLGYTSVEVRPSSSTSSQPYSGQAYPPSLGKPKTGDRTTSAKNTTTYKVSSGRATIIPSSDPPSVVSSSAPSSTPGLSNLPPVSRLRSDSANDLTSGMPPPPPTSSRSAGKKPARNDDLGGEADRRRSIYERLQAQDEADRREARRQAQEEEDERQARLVRDSLAGTEQRQRDRVAALAEERQRRQEEAEQRQRRQDEADERQRDRAERAFAARQQQIRDEAATRERERLAREEDARLAAEDARIRAEEDRLAAIAALEGDRLAQRTHEALADQARANERERERAARERTRRVQAELKKMAEERADADQRDSALATTSTNLYPSPFPYSAGGPGNYSSYPSDPRISPLSPRLSSSSLPPWQRAALPGTISPPISPGGNAAMTTTGRRNIVIHNDGPSSSNLTSPSGVRRSRRESGMFGRGEDVISRFSSASNSATPAGARDSSFTAEMGDAMARMRLEAEDEAVEDEFDADRERDRARDYRRGERRTGRGKGKEREARRYQ